jgi:hypothetical protein
VPNNLDLVPTWINISPQQLIVAIANIPPTIDALAFADPMGEFFWVLELEFPVESSEKKFIACHLFSTKGWNPQDALQEVSQA